MVIAEVAGRQHAVIARWQLLALGVGRGGITHRLASGRLHRVFPGVYAVGHKKITLRGRWMAAVLACGKGAVLSHVPAGVLHNVARTSAGRVDVTVPRSRRGIRGIVIHRVRDLHPDDVTVIDGIPVTSLARTLLDLAGSVPEWRFQRAFEDATKLPDFDARKVNELLDRHPRRKGRKRLATLVEKATAPSPYTRSGLERRFLRLCRETGIPTPSVNADIAGHEVDISWPDTHLVVELDVDETHGDRVAFERDRRRDADLALNEHHVLRVTGNWIDEDPGDVERTVRRLRARYAAAAVRGPGRASTDHTANASTDRPTRPSLTIDTFRHSSMSPAPGER
jgi:predicted transcriptional regulator of viral defense system